MQHQRLRNGPFLLCLYWSVVIFKTKQGIFLSDSRKMIFPRKIRIVTLTKKKKPVLLQLTSSSQHFA